MFCKNNWINISWEGFPVRQEKENLTVRFEQRAKTLIDFDLACDIAASEIYDTHKNLYLALSGGSDSEYVASCLVRNGIPFIPIIINYNHVTHNDQRYEQWYAKMWCKKNQITPLIVDIGNYTQSADEKEKFTFVKPRINGSVATLGYISNLVRERGGQLITGNQLEYYPDVEQMTYLEPQLGDYVGFVMEESDYYLEVMEPNRHPWAFYYWSPETMAGFVSKWDTSLTMQENKSAIYKTSLRPKFDYPHGFFTEQQGKYRALFSKQKWGTLDCALLGTKEHLLAQILE